MNHSEAIEQMAAERYLLDELPPELREAFEEHVFDCRECALDLRAGAAFVDEARVQLPGLTAPARELPPARRGREIKRQWFSWWSPAFAVPAMAVLAAVIAYQNIATIPALRSAASRPEVLPWSSVHVATRGAAPTPVIADRDHGVVLLVDLPQEGTYASYTFALYDSQGKQAWSSGVVTPAPGETGAVSLLIPGQGMEQGSYTLAISGVLATGQTTELGRRSFDISFGSQ
jgi:hypothetical protein